jgi:hypothetical protein
MLRTTEELSLGSPSDIFVEQYKTAAAEGAVVELKMRMLADKVPELQKYAHAQNLEDIEAEIAGHFGDALSEDERTTLALCRQLRNKVLHCKFHAAREKLEKLGFDPQRSGVKKIVISGLPPDDIVQKIRSALGADESAFEYVAGTSSTDPGSIFAWLLELGHAGDFGMASDAFRKAATIINRLSYRPSAVSNL